MKKKYIKFRGIDSWNRPIFQSINDKMFFGSCFRLFSYEDEPEKIVEFFKKHSQELVYMGSRFDCEPLGLHPSELREPLELIIV